MSAESDLAEIVDACRDRLAARTVERASVASSQDRRERAMWRLAHEEGLPPARIAALIHERLLAAGFATEDIRGLGVSKSSVRMAVERPRP